MRVHHLHRWDVSYREAVAIQEELREKLILHDRYFPQEIRTIGGSDISYSKRNSLFFAAVVILEYPSMNIIEEASIKEHVLFPYVPGLLSFREGPALIKAFERLHTTPDVVILDGQGVSHPRGIGLASHIGLLIDVPTIGCAKKRLVGQYDDVGPQKGDYADLMFNNRIVGAVVRTKEKVKPVFVSAGHKTSTEKAVEIVLSCCRGYRIPEPVRQAHLAVNRMRLQVSFC